MPFSRTAKAAIILQRAFKHSSHSSQIRAPFRRSYAHVPAPRRHETFDVKCRSHGSITIDVFHSSTASSPIIVYLPPSPVSPPRSVEDEQIISILQETSSATVARIHYRASEQYPYPTPIHDVLSGYDWIREHLLRDEFQRPYLSRLGVVGELMGGSLATMLALTECRLGESRIGAAALNNPIADWVFPDELPLVDLAELPEPMRADETAIPADEDMASSISVSLEELLQPDSPKRQKRRPKKVTATAWQRYGDSLDLPTSTLVEQRDGLFRRPEDYLDRFASPVHFFRSPHVQLIQPQQDDYLASQQPDDLHDAETQMALSHFASFDGSVKPAVTELPTLARCRAYTRGYPPAGLNLSLPVWHVTTGLESPLHGQAIELARLLRQSVARHRLKSYSGRSRWHDATEKEQYAEYAETRVTLAPQSGTGLWADTNDDPQWRKSVQDVGAWMKRRLAPEFI